MKRALVAVLLLPIACAGVATHAAKDEPRFARMGEADIAAELKRVHAANASLPERIVAVSERFLGMPYVLGPLGEGPAGEFDHDPLVSFREVDCTTFVEETMALSLEPDLTRAVDLLQKIRYRDGKVSYETRNHFTEVDWIANNAAAGYLKDATVAIAGARARVAEKVISKRAWYAGKTAADLKDFPGTPAEKDKLLAAWKARGAGLNDDRAQVPYIPLDALSEFASKIPSGAILNLVRQDMPGKPVLISHQQLLIQKPEGAFVRHAHAGTMVEDAPLLEYFRVYAGSKWPLLGVNVNTISSPQSATTEAR